MLQLTLMKKLFVTLLDVFILVTVWLFFAFLLVHAYVINFYFEELEVPINIAIVSVFLLAIAYTIFWVKRFKSSRIK